MEMFATTTNNNSSTKENSLNIPEKDMCQSSSSAPSSPTKGSVSFTEMLNKKTDSANASKSVKFPEDHFIVTGYHDAPDPFGSANDQNEENDQLDLDTIIKAFTDACAKQNIEPMPSVLEQIKKFKSIRDRAQDLILRGQKLESHQCEALEEILKRVLFRLIDLDSCDLDCDGASALFDMIEFYESASHLSIANNKSIGIIGWQALCRTLKKTSCLQYLDLSNTGLNEQILLFMGRTIRVGSHLVTLHLENAGLFGRRLAILVSSIKFNTSLRELYLGENKIGSADCVQIGNLLRGNSFLNVLDLRNNLIQDTGLDHVCEGLAHQPYASPGAGSGGGTIFGLFDPNHKRNTAVAAATPMSQNNGILIMNLSNNQLTSRAMNRLAQTLPNCRSLIGLDLSYNPIGDEGIFILKESLLNCPTLKYLNLTETDIGPEGIRTVADILQGPTNLTVVDLSNNNNNNNNNDFGLEGLMAIRDAVVANKRIQKVIIGGGQQPTDSIHQLNPLWAQLLDEIENHCQKHQAEAEAFDEFDSILNGFLRKDISVYLEIDQSSTTTNDYSDDDNNKENVDNNTNDDNYQTCDSTNDSNVNDDGDHQPGSKKPLLARTASLGSWERPVKSGRFSVQPVGQPVVVQNHDQNNNNNQEAEEEPALATPIRIHIESDYSQVQVEPRDEQEAGQRSSAPEEEEEEEEENEGSDLSEQETDQLAELPARFAKKNHLAPPSRSFRRMSSPVLSVSGIVKPKPKPNLSLKLSGNLESLDLKSSTPLSPTFFAKFDFSDISLLRLPAEVEEIISNIDHSITDDLIVQFENFCCEKPSKLKSKQQQQQQQQQLDQQEQCVY